MAELMAAFHQLRAFAATIARTVERCSQRLVTATTFPICTEILPPGHRFLPPPPAREATGFAASTCVAAGSRR